MSNKKDLIAENEALRRELERVQAEADARLDEAYRLLEKASEKMHGIFDQVNCQAHDLDVQALEIKNYLK